tara:strand:+ start:392 stop:823 length:432 start_codon:yes stop_codon:yes gene_type:complete
MSQLNMKELYSTIDEKVRNRMELYDSVLQKCHKRIKYNSTLERTYCFYQIPEFIIGVPLYDVGELRLYIMNSLKKNGFKLIYVEPNWLFISWEMKGTKKLIEDGAKNYKQTKVVKNDYRSVDTFKPSGIYDEATMMGFTDKLK